MVPGLDPTTTLNHLKEEPKTREAHPTPPEDSTPKPIPTALAQARGSSDRRHLLFSRVPCPFPDHPGDGRSPGFLLPPLPQHPPVIPAPEPESRGRVRREITTRVTGAVLADRKTPIENHLEVRTALQELTRYGEGVPEICSISLRQTRTSLVRLWGHSWIPGPVVPIAAYSPEGASDGHPALDRSVNIIEQRARPAGSPSLSGGACSPGPPTAGTPAKRDAKPIRGQKGLFHRQPKT